MKKFDKKKIDTVSILARIFLFPLLIFGIVMKIYDELYSRIKESINK